MNKVMDKTQLAEKRFRDELYKDKKGIKLKKSIKKQPEKIRKSEEEF